MDLFGLIGKKLSHSFSPDYFKKKFDKLNIDANYQLFEIQNIAELPDLINKHKNLKGLNVTIPYKKAVIPYLNRIEDTARQLGSVNTIHIDQQGDRPILKGFNTDIIGFEQSLEQLTSGKVIKRALILGTGGSAQSVAFVLSKLKIEYYFVSRNRKVKNVLNYNDLTNEIVTNYNLIINSTPVGMYPSVEDSPPIPYELITPDHLLFDLIYNPPETIFLKNGRRRGASVCNGMKMLELQAEASWNIWQSRHVL